MKPKLINYEIGFSDSEIHNYYVTEKDVSMTLKCWNDQFIELKFINFICLNSTNYFDTSMFQEVFESPILSKAIKIMYDEPPLQHNLRVFQILDTNDDVAFEIVCEGLKIRKIEDAFFKDY